MKVLRYSTKQKKRIGELVNGHDPIIRRMNSMDWELVFNIAMGLAVYDIAYTIVHGIIRLIEGEEDE